MIRLTLAVGSDPQPRDFADEAITIGRSSMNHLRIRDPRVSRFHARIAKGGELIRLADLQSGNGTRLNGVEVESGFLAVGDVIEIGRTRLAVLRLETTALPPTPPPRAALRPGRGRTRRLLPV